MTHSVERLHAGDCEEVVGFLDRVFSQHNGFTMDIAKKFPRIFTDTEETMGWYYAVREGGAIVGTAAHHPMTYKVGESLLRVSAGGNVAVDPDYRNQGIMQALMRRINDVLVEENMDLAYLHGDRKRYRTFGFERCGLQYNFSYTKSFLEQLGHVGGFALSDLRQESAEVPEQVAQIMARRRSGFVRKTEEVLPALCAQERLPLVVRNKQHRVVGYISMDVKNCYIDELGLETAEDFGNVLMSAMLFAEADKLLLCIPEFEWEMVAKSLAIGARYQILQPANFQILRFDRVVQAFMQAKCAYAPVLDGSLTIQSDLFGKWRVTCRSGQVSVVPDGGEADLTVNGYQIYSFLFGPCPPVLAAVYPREIAALVSNWFPIPLFCPNLS